MTEDVLEQLNNFVTDEQSTPAAVVVAAIEEIELLRSKIKTSARWLYDADIEVTRLRENLARLILSRLTCSYSDPPCEECTFCAARAEIERLRVVLGAVDDLHSPRLVHDSTCAMCGHDWPCETHLLVQEARRD